MKKRSVGVAIAISWMWVACGNGGSDVERAPRPNPTRHAVVETTRAPAPQPAAAPAPATTAEGNDVVKRCVDEGASTYEKDQCQAQYKNKPLEFVVEVKDIRDAKTLHVMIDSGNYADVTFKKKIADKVAVGDTIRFTGKVTFFGSGILFSHDIKATDLTVE